MAARKAMEAENKTTGKPEPPREPAEGAADAGAGASEKPGSEPPAMAQSASETSTPLVAESTGKRGAPPISARTGAGPPRPNGDYGVATEEDPDWSLRLVGLMDMSSAQMPDAAGADPTGSGATTGKDGATPAPGDKKAGRDEVGSGQEASSDS